MREADVSAFEARIGRQRISPRLWDFAYLHFRSNLRTFRLFSSRIREVPGVRVLDVGCGFKPWSSLLPPDAIYLGVDYDRTVSRADATASGDALPFADSTFDAVICSEVLEHTRQPTNVVMELRRVVKPGGHIYVSTPFFFPEHGAPYDFQRPTSCYYRAVFSSDIIHELVPSNSIFSMPFAALNFCFESTPLRLLKGIKEALYICVNITSLILDAVARAFWRLFTKNYVHYFCSNPVGFSLVVQTQKH